MKLNSKVRKVSKEYKALKGLQVEGPQGQQGLPGIAEYDVREYIIPLLVDVEVIDLPGIKNGHFSERTIELYPDDWELSGAALVTKTYLRFFPTTYATTIKQDILFPPDAQGISFWVSSSKAEEEYVVHVFFEDIMIWSESFDSVTYFKRIIIPFDETFPKMGTLKFYVGIFESNDSLFNLDEVTFIKFG